ncbi:MAG: hypothetical protein LBS51_06255 [Oscillospiraceae bacterium]|jgi:hypothetical protein|nr:hypothetical protein [Oscillospiraceae bacterium]
MANIANFDYLGLDKYIQEELVADFYGKRLEKLDGVRLNTLLKRKNPYLYRAKNLQTGEHFVRQILDAFLSSSEETQFGDLMEKLSIHICGEVFGGRKSAASSIDLEFTRDEKYYIVSVKSSPNWGNSSQISKMKANFTTAKRILGTNSSIRNVIAVNGCCFGKDDVPDKGDYLKLCGQRYWTFISGDEDLYLKIIKPLGDQAKEKDAGFQTLYVKRLNEMTADFLSRFCPDGLIDWEILVKYNSEANIKRF